MLEALAAALIVGRVLSGAAGIDYFLFFLSAQEVVRPGWVPAFCLSLLNTGLKIRENGMLPYVSHLYSQENETRASLLSLDILGLCLTREHRINQVKCFLDNDGLAFLFLTAVLEDRQSTGVNLDQTQLFKIDYFGKWAMEHEEPINLAQWAAALYTNIRNPYDTANTLLPMSMKKSRLFEESLFFLMRFSRLNEKFIRATINAKKYGSLVYLLIKYLCEEVYSKEDNHFTVEVILSYLIQETGQRDFCCWLNDPVPESVIIPQISVVSGSSIDLIIVALCQLVSEKQEVGKWTFNYLAIMRNV